MSIATPMTELCEGLSNALDLYSTTNLRTLQGILLALTLGSVANAFFSFLTCLLPRRHIMKGVVLSLVVLPIAILLSFLILNSRRDNMRLHQFNISDTRSLDLQARICGIILPTDKIESVTYDFNMNGRRNDSWQLYIVLLFAGATIALGTRIFLSIAVNMNSDNGSGRGGHPFSMKQHTPSEIQQLLLRLRVEIPPQNNEDGQVGNNGNNTGVPHTIIREKECAICLEDMSDNVSRLQCGHIFHEKCLEKWIHTASFDTVCPMCKAPVWEEPAGRFSWEGTRDSISTASTVSSPSPSSSSISVSVSTEDDTDEITAAAVQHDSSEEEEALQPVFQHQEGSVSIPIDEENTVTIPQTVRVPDGLEIV